MKTSDIVTRDELKAELNLVVKAVQLEMAGLAARSDRIEARLATVATKQQLDEAASRLATKQELAEAVSKLATKDEIAKLATKDDIRAFGRQIAALKPRNATRG